MYCLVHSFMGLAQMILCLSATLQLEGILVGLRIKGNRYVVK